MSRSWKILLVTALSVLGCGISFMAGRSVEADEAQEPRLYELRIYTTHPGRLEALHSRFRDHTTKLFEKHGMKNHMYWVPTEEKTKDNTLIYVVSHKNKEAADKSWAAFVADPEWKRVQEASEKDGKIVAKVDKYYMQLVDYSPEK